MTEHNMIVAADSKTNLKAITRLERLIGLQLGCANQASDYEATTEFMINYIMKTFEFGNDNVTAFKKPKQIDRNPWKQLQKPQYKNRNPST